MSATIEQSLAARKAPVVSGEQQAEDSSQQFFVGMIAKPKQKDPVLGVVVIGLGIADMQAVRRFAKLGMVAMQIRLIKDAAHHNDFDRRFATYDATGVSRCRQAMDFLTAQHNVRQFILVGNCTLANICFNTALVDQRVTGLAITNPYIPEALCETAFFKIRKHLFRRASWLRLFTGRMKVPRVSLTASANPKASDDSSKPASSSVKRDTILPNDFEIKLEKLLTERAVQALLVFSSAETSLHYFRYHYGKTLAKLSRAGQLRFEIATTEAHDFSANDDCAAALNEVLSDWVTRTWISAPSAESLLGPTADLS